MVKRSQDNFEKEHLFSKLHGISWMFSVSCVLGSFISIEPLPIDYNDFELLSVQGSRRFNRLSAAARAGHTIAPVDMRYLRKGLPTRGDSGGDSARGRVVSFLRGIYESIAETLPDVRDDSFDGDTGLEAFQAQLPQSQPDPYCKALETQARLQIKPSTRGIRKRRMGLDLNTTRRPEEGFEKRWLPPGCIKDYYEQFLVADKNFAGGSDCSTKPVAFSTFWRTWYQDFGEIMVFRPVSSHAVCGTCVRHKLLIKGMAGHLRARQAQIEFFSAHLQSQYNDRLCYWDLRAQSRLRSRGEVLVILDGMDQNKFLYPRSDHFKSKDLASFARPKAHCTGAIIHGWAIVFAISPADLRKDANSSIELLAFCLQLLSKKIDLTKVILSIQSDNTSREVKNNIVLRWVASLVCHGCSVVILEFFSFLLCGNVFHCSFSTLKRNFNIDSKVSIIMPISIQSISAHHLLSLLHEVLLGVPGYVNYVPGTPMKMWISYLGA